MGEVLRARRADPRPCLAGLDFGFSVPAWYAGARGWRSAAEVWAAAGDDGERWLAECAPPFWGRPGHPRPHDVDAGLRQTERAWSMLQRPKSVFQVGGAGSVGTGSIRGMPMLLSLRQAGWAVWPFDARGDHTLVEIYPRLFTGRVIKRSAEARGEFSPPIAARCRPGSSAACWRRKTRSTPGCRRSACRAPLVVQNRGVSSQRWPRSRGRSGRRMVRRRHPGDSAAPCYFRPATTRMVTGADTSSGEITLCA